MTEAYRQGFLAKCAEYGVSERMARIMFGTGTGIVKCASPFARRLLAMFPEMKVTPKLLGMLERQGTTIPYLERGLSKHSRRLVESARRSGTPSLMELKSVFAGDPVGFKNAVRERWLPKSVSSSNEGLLSLLPNTTVQDLATPIPKYFRKKYRPREVYINMLRNSRKALAAAYKNDKSLNDALSHIETGPELTAAQFMERHPYGRYAYKGSGFTGSNWDITQPAWFSGRPSIALGYSTLPTVAGIETPAQLISAIDLNRSKAFKTGKTFFTGHVADGKRSLRKKKMEAGQFFHGGSSHPADKFHDYEIVIPGHEAKAIPQTPYLVSGHGGYRHDLLTAPSESFSSLPYTFRPVKDVKGYENLLSEIGENQKKLSNAASNTDHWASQIRGDSYGYITPDSIERFFESNIG